MSFKRLLLIASLLFIPLIKLNSAHFPVLNDANRIYWYESDFGPRDVSSGTKFHNGLDINFKQIGFTVDDDSDIASPIFSIEDRVEMKL